MGGEDFGFWIANFGLQVTAMPRNAAGTADGLFLAGPLQRTRFSQSVNTRPLKRALRRNILSRRLSGTHDGFAMDERSFAVQSG